MSLQGTGPWSRSFLIQGIALTALRSGTQVCALLPFIYPPKTPVIAPTHISIHRCERPIRMAGLAIDLAVVRRLRTPKIPRRLTVQVWDGEAQSHA